MYSSKYSDSAKFFKALGDENRLRVLELLMSGEKCACNLLEEMKISQPTLSHHMRLLCDAGIVQSRKDGKWVHYSIAKDAISKIDRDLKSVMGLSEA